jgi:Protein of unknown function (DUF3016)
MNIDLAGQFEPWRALATDVRVMRDIYPPRITLRFKLIDNSRTSLEGEDELVDLNYLANPDTRLIGDPLRYEKAMLSGWFRNRLLSAKSVYSGS